MSRKRSEERTGLSPIQRKACVVMAFCVLAVVLSFLVSWILPAKLGLFGESDLYDPTQYPLDTSLGSILGQESAQGNYINDTVFVGGTQAVSMSKDSSITLNQYAGKDGLKVSQVLRETCVNFADDANSYTIPQAIAKMKPLHVYVMVGSDDLDGSVSVDEFVNDYKQILQSIKSAYSACDVVACAIAPVSGTPRRRLSSELHSPLMKRARSRRPSRASACARGSASSPSRRPARSRRRPFSSPRRGRARARPSPI